MKNVDLEHIRTRLTESDAFTKIEGFSNDIFDAFLMNVDVDPETGYRFLTVSVSTESNTPFPVSIDLHWKNPTDANYHLRIARLAGHKQVFCGSPVNYNALRVILMIIVGAEVDSLDVV